MLVWTQSRVTRATSILFSTFYREITLSFLSDFVFGLRRGPSILCGLGSRARERSLDSVELIRYSFNDNIVEVSEGLTTLKRVPKGEGHKIKLSIRKEHVYAIPRQVASSSDNFIIRRRPYPIPQRTVSELTVRDGPPTGPLRSKLNREN